MEQQAENKSFINGVRYILVDFNHICIKYMAMDELSVPVKTPNGVETVVTTIPNYAIKNIFNLSGRGQHLIGVCLEGQYGSAKRRDFFRNIPGNEEYKSGRKPFKGHFYRQVDFTVNLLHQSGVSLYKDPESEADDCIYSLVKRLKEEGVKNRIDIITNDADLLPLVDEQVSVYMKSTIQYNEPDSPVVRGYYQVTPESWETFFENRSEFKEFIIPYNSVVLYKLIRGDNSDKVKGALQRFGKVKYNDLMLKMIKDGVDFENIFRYGNDFVTVIQPVLLKYFSQDIVDHMHVLYLGFSPVINNFALPQRIMVGQLQQTLLPLKINLPLPK